MSERQSKSRAWYLIPVAAAAALGIAMTVHAVADRPARTPVPDAMPAVLEAERRVVYLVNEIGAEPGEPRVCVCESASVGTSPPARRPRAERTLGVDRGR